MTPLRIKFYPEMLMGDPYFSVRQLKKFLGIFPYQLHFDLIPASKKQEFLEKLKTIHPHVEVVE